MEIGADRTKLMINSANGIHMELKWKKPGSLPKIKCIEAVVSNDGSNPEVNDLMNCTSHCSSNKA